MKKMYILVNKKLSKSQRIPQAAHAVAEFMGEYGQEDDVKDWLKNHRTMVCLQVDPHTLFTFDSKLKCSKFYDEDLPDIWLTAIAYYPTEDGSEFSEFRLA